MKRLFILLFFAAAPSLAVTIVTEPLLPATCEPARTYRVQDAPDPITCNPGGPGGGPSIAICLCDAAGTGYIAQERIDAAGDATLNAGTVSGALTAIGGGSIAATDFAAATDLDLAGAIALSACVEVQGSVAYYNGTAWSCLDAGLAGQVFKSQGAGANPRWGTDNTGGGGANSFETHAAPAGTNPVATSATDILTWTVAGPLVLTGDALTNAMAFSWLGAFDDEQISESSVTQHEAALSITESQIPDLSHFSPNADPGVDHSSYVPGHTIQDETVGLAQRPTLNFTGPGIDCVDNAGQTRTDCTVTSGGSGEINTASNLGGGLANYSTKVGVDLRFNSFAAADFNLAANLISIDDAAITITESQVSDLHSPSNSFATMNAPAGTDPVADSPTDTLNFTVVGPLVLTGAAGTDTLAFSWSGAFADAQIAQSNVTQHEAALSITESQIPDLTHFAPNADPGVDHSSYVAGHGNGANCLAGSYPLGVDGAGAVEDCTDASTEIDASIATHAGNASAHHAATVDTGPVPDCATAGDVQTGDGSCVDPATQAELDTHEGNASAHHGHEKCINIDPAATVTDWFMYRFNRAATINGIDCIVDAATSVVLTLRECDGNGGTCAATEAAMTCGPTNTTEAAGIDDPNGDAGDYMRVLRGTVTGSPTQAMLCFHFTYN